MHAQRRIALTTSHAPGTPRPSVAASLFLALRPAQWTKNLIVFAALIFGQRLLDVDSVVRAAVAFLAFCALSGVVYILNDVVDREADRQHPLKRFRPIAAGHLSVTLALTTAGVLLTGALLASLWLGPAFLVHAAAYVLLQVAYSLGLKRQVILDVLSIALGFVIRASAGGAAIHVPVSQWLLVCTILLALFLALAKRRHEITLLGEDAARHRAILGEYTPYLVDQMISVVTASTLMGYAFYTVSSDTTERFGTKWLGLTLPFPLYGIFRYLYLVHRRSQGGSPTELLLADRPLLLCVALWGATTIALIYHPWTLAR
ncbi:decaprenyl-phosphate phosphoribosyltransferase [Luteitalea pratensis]|uniref:decaprenyl-phosphate phosphoribosyltransferase n=1 Tax=Luteitalea pratensis TaxID=1855912 RepID=UPI001F006BBE|nr:decaprenyl-phosphate phosphoribosyltransferase [Luteitalea pratensis]